MSTVSQVLEDAKEALALGYRGEAAAILCHFAEGLKDQVNDVFHPGLIYQDMSKMIDRIAFLGNYPELQKMTLHTNINLLRHEMLHPHDRVSTHVADEATEGNPPPSVNREATGGQVDSSNFEKVDEAMRLINANHLFPNESGVASLSEDFYNSLRDIHGISFKKIMKYTGDEYKVTKVFTDIKARDKSNQTRDLHYVPAKSWPVEGYQLCTWR